MKTAQYFFLSILALAMNAHAGDNPRIARAVRVAVAPRIDGMLDDAAWKTAEPATDFIQRDPDEGKPASERSEIRILYDDDAIYFGCTFTDAEPEKIVARLTRRDDEIESDFGSIRIDSYHDHQTAFEFTFNAAGVKTDILQYDDGGREDASWDVVWEVETRITRDGWTAELRIPFHALRYRAAQGVEVGDWGINFIRYISRKQESSHWAFIPKSQTGFVSRFGHLTGFDRLPEESRAEVLPFVVARQRFAPEGEYTDRTSEFRPDAGLDVKYGLSSSFTLDATFNPDFGQVEADPAVLNLSTFETFYPEKRPFFIEGTQILRFKTYGDQSGPGMFYSRRIGRAISDGEADVPDGGRIESMPQYTTILGAAKLSGKTNGGLALGVLEAVTQKEHATIRDSLGRRTDETLEPLGHYNVIRVKQDLMQNSTIGAIVTSVAKDGRPPAFTNGYDWNLRFDNNTYALDGFFAWTRATNRDAERVSGYAGKIQFARVAGEHWLWSASLDATTKQYNINDAGFFFRPNDWGPIATLTFKEDRPAAVVRRYSLGMFLHERRNFDGINLLRQAQLYGNMRLTNYWSFYLGVNYDGGEYDDRETRGNGLYAKPHSSSISFSFATDPRFPVVIDVSQSFGRDEKRLRSSSTGIELEVKPVSWMQWDLEAGYHRRENYEAWVANIYDRTTTSVFGDRTTTEYDFTMRGTLTFTRELTFQFYGQLFLAKGSYDNYRTLVGTSDFQSYSYGGDPNFNEQSFMVNAVLRWEYLPGSTAYLVWSQSRGGDGSDPFTRFGHDLADAMRRVPTNVVLLKVSYWWHL